MNVSLNTSVGALVLCVLVSCALGDSPEGTDRIEASGGQQVTVLAASSLTDAFGDLGRTFQDSHPGTVITSSFAGSDTLASQILQGAPADVFASASPKEMDILIKAHKIAGKPRVFATNRLVVITPSDNPAHITSLHDLARPGVKVVLAAAGVPAGDYARQIFEKLGIYAAVTANVVSNELDDQSVLSKVRLGEADAGIVYVSDLSGSAQGDVHDIAIPNAQNVVATYEIAVLKDAPNPEGASAFEQLVLSDNGQATLRRYGFGAH